jgi:ABC-2 type transport system ATP-binding protein
LFAQHGDEIADLEVRRASLEETYMSLVRAHEDVAQPSDTRPLAEMAR